MWQLCIVYFEIIDCFTSPHTLFTSNFEIVQLWTNSILYSNFSLDTLCNNILINIILPLTYFHTATMSRASWCQSLISPHSETRNCKQQLLTTSVYMCQWTPHSVMQCVAVHFCLFRMNDVKITEISKFHQNPIVLVDIIGWKLGRLPDRLQSTDKDRFQIASTDICTKWPLF